MCIKSLKCIIFSLFLLHFLLCSIICLLIIKTITFLTSHISEVQPTKYAFYSLANTTFTKRKQHEGQEEIFDIFLNLKKLNTWLQWAEFLVRFN